MSGRTLVQGETTYPYSSEIAVALVITSELSSIRFQIPLSPSADLYPETSVETLIRWAGTFVYHRLCCCHLDFILDISANPVKTSALPYQSLYSLAHRHNVAAEDDRRLGSPECR